VTGVNAQPEAQAQAARAARESYGRLLALLASRSGDLAGAEDALAEAFAQALTTWPERGVPSNPEAWLLTVARHRQRDTWRSAASRLEVPLNDDDGATERNFEGDDMGVVPFNHPASNAAAFQVDPDNIPDQRLKLLFVCAHPAIDETLRAPLMLQVVLGLDAQTIARAFLMPTATLAQRLVRAKRKIKDAVIPFAIPSRSDMPGRLEAVLEAIYGAFAIGWDVHSEGQTTHNPDNPDNPDSDLADEARFLADLLVQLNPDHAEVLGLAACIALASARRAARFSAAGQYVPLDEQDCGRWDPRLIGWGERLLQRARGQGSIGRFQLEAAIQSVHNHRAHSGVTDWQALALLYEGLMQTAPSVGAAVARAVAVGNAQTPDAGLAALDQIEPALREQFQPAWAARAHLCAAAGRPGDALAAVDRALALTVATRVRAYLTGQRRRWAAASAGPSATDAAR
jgi:predicted RNA polymerase sigma factor